MGEKKLKEIVDRLDRRSIYLGENLHCFLTPEGEQKIRCTVIDVSSEGMGMVADPNAIYQVNQGDEFTVPFYIGRRSSFSFKVKIASVSSITFQKEDYTRIGVQYIFDGVSLLGSDFPAGLLPNPIVSAYATIRNPLFFKDKQMFLPIKWWSGGVSLRAVGHNAIFFPGQPINLQLTLPWSRNVAVKASYQGKIDVENGVKDFLFCFEETDEQKLGDMGSYLVHCDANITPIMVTDAGFHIHWSELCLSSHTNSLRQGICDSESHQRIEPHA